MKESIYKSYDELPLFLNAATVAKVDIPVLASREIWVVPVQPGLTLSGVMVAPVPQQAPI